MTWKRIIGFGVGIAIICGFWITRAHLVISNNAGFPRISRLIWGLRLTFKS